MQVSSLLSRYFDQSSVSKRSESNEPSRDQQLENKPLDLLSTKSCTTSAQEILSQYDVSDITPREFSEMLQSLHASGVITDQQYQDLSTLRAELDAQGIEPDEKIDLVQFCERRLEDARDSNAESSLVSTMERRLESLRKFALIQSTPELASLNYYA